MKKFSYIISQDNNEIFLEDINYIMIKRYITIYQEGDINNDVLEEEVYFDSNDKTFLNVIEEFFESKRKEIIEHG